MPVKLLPLRFLNPSIPTTRFSHMNIGSSFHSTPGPPILCRVFPFKLKYLALSRKFSTRTDSGSVGFSRSSDFSRVRASKSLVEDEAELSDWISELKSDSGRSRFRDDEGDKERSGLRGGRGWGRGRGRDSFGSSKRQRDSDSDDFGGSGRRGGYGSDSGSKRRIESSEFGGSRGSGSRRGGRDSDSRNGFRQFGGEDREGGFPRRGGYRGGRDSGSSYGNSFGSRGGRGGGRDSGSGGYRGGRGSGSSYRGGRDLNSGSDYGFRKYGSDLEERDDGRGRGGGRDSIARRDGRGSEFSYGRSRGGGIGSEFGYGRGRGGGRSMRGGKTIERRSPLLSEDEDDESDDDDEEDDDDEFNMSSIGGDLDISHGRGRGGGRGSQFGSGRGRGGVSSMRGGKTLERGSTLLFEDDIDDDDEDDDEVEKYKMSSIGRDLAMSNGRSRGGGRGSQLGNVKGRGGGTSMRGGKTMERRSSLLSEDGDEYKMSSIGDVLKEEDSEGSDEEGDEDVKLASSLFGSAKVVNSQVASTSSSGNTASYLSETRFDQCSVSPLSLKGIKDAGYEKMTIVQEATLPVILKGKDVLAKAKTGTGKTVAFLLPSIEVVVKSPSVDRDQKRPPITVLVICPTRELANQAANEANTLLKYHNSIGVQVVIGGTRLALEQKRMQSNPCQILVATPGRLKDHIENTAGFATRLMGVKVLVLDEADHLLDMGFRKDIERIIAAVPKQRQTLLFSATVPEEVRQICHIALKRDHEFINTVEEGSEETHAQVRQTHLIAPLDNHFPLLYTLLKEHISNDADYKVLVFCTTAMVTRFVAGLLGELNLNVREIHSRKPQSYRTRISDEFRKSKGLILVTSDVSARGVDYPDVTLVIQVGLPADREQYIHRLGRTGRKGKEGQGILLLAPWEEFFLSSIKDLPITKASSIPTIDSDTKKKVERALSQVEMKSKEAAYQAWLGYYNSVKKVGGDKCRLVELANEFSRTMGLDTPPAIAKIVLGKMGLRNVPGLRSK